MLLNEAGYYSFQDNKFHFYIKDHQGNVRVVADETGKVDEVNDYYPFVGLMSNVCNNVQLYKYNGKELDRKGGLDWYDYGARQYDAALGKWHTVDPLVEKYCSISPYAYCAGNPIKYIDPDGRTVIIWYKGDNGKMSSYTYSGGNATHSNPFVQSVITAYRYNKENGIKAGNGGGASTVEVVETTNIKVNVMEAVYENKYSKYEENRVKGSDLQYGTKEERRVITGSEQKTSRANGEIRAGQVTRRNHKGKTVITQGVTSNVIDRKKTLEYENREEHVWTSEP